VDLLRCERLTSLDPATRERILCQNYAMLISMAPISTETQVITSCLPVHFGPSIPEVTSAWFKLYLYEVAGSGPATKLFARGRRIHELPTIFKGFDNVKLNTWKHDPIILPLHTLLPQLNEALLESPVLVQAYGKKSHFVDVSFPVEIVPIGKQEENHQYTESELEQHPTIQKIQQALNLQYTFGFIRMMKVESDQNCDWVPFEINYGMPLGDITLNEIVCNKVMKYKLFSEENISKHSKSTRELCVKLLDFISLYQDEELELDPENIPFPARNITFTKGKLF